MYLLILSSSRHSHNAWAECLVGAIAAGMESLPYGEEAVDIRVMEEEDGVESSSREVRHVAASLIGISRTANIDVDGVVDGLETGGAAAGAT